MVVMSAGSATRTAEETQQCTAAIVGNQSELPQGHPRWVVVWQGCLCEGNERGSTTIKVSSEACSHSDLADRGEVGKHTGSSA